MQGNFLPDASDVDQIRRDNLRQKFDVLKEKSDLIDQSPGVLHNLQHAREHRTSNLASAFPIKKHWFTQRRVQRCVCSSIQQIHYSNLLSVFAVPDSTQLNYELQERRIHQCP